MKNLNLEGAKNIRDLGGMPTRDGIINEKKILRGNCLDNITQEDIDILKEEYKISSIIDLRTEKERTERPDVIINGVEYINNPIFNKSVPGITHEQNSGKAIFNMKEMYGAMLSEKYIDKISQIIKTIINKTAENKTVFFHCTGGKDRTGVIAAVILMLLQVDKKNILKDYLYTNKVNKKRALKKYWYNIIIKHDIQGAKNIMNGYLAKKEYLLSAMSNIEKTWKDENYFIKEGLKIDDNKLKIFRDIMIKKN